MRKTECWKAVSNYVGLYEVSDRGRVRRIAPGRKTWVGKILKPGKSWAYYYVNLVDGDGCVSSRRIHRLVLESFCGPSPSSKHMCNHKDGNKRNNLATNLEWVTRSENARHAVSLGLIAVGERGSGAKISEKQARKILSLKGREPQRITAERFGLKKLQIYRIQAGRSWRQVLSAV